MDEASSRMPRLILSHQSDALNRRLKMVGISVSIFIFNFWRASLFRKKTFQQRAALFQPHAGKDFAAMIQRGKLQKIHRTACRTRLRITRTEYDARQPRVDDRARAHRTWL